jgi:hypothetical protein
MTALRSLKLVLNYASQTLHEQITSVTPGTLLTPLAPSLAGWGSSSNQASSGILRAARLRQGGIGAALAAAAAARRRAPHLLPAGP